MRYLLDTDTCVEVIRGREPATRRVRRHSPEDLLISAMTLAELRYGALNSSKPEGSLRAVEAFLSAPLDIVAFDATAARTHAAIRLALRSRPIGERDLIIAATAKTLGLTLVTHNLKHFSRVEGLALEDWISDEHDATTLAG